MLLGIDIGGTNTKLGLFSPDLKMLGKTSVPTDPAGGPVDVIDRISQTATKLVSDLGHDMQDVKAAGIGAPGPAKIAEGIIEFAPNMPGFENIPIKAMLSEKLGIPVVFENDANAACWGEFVAGAGRGVSDMVLVALGTGIGGGVVSNGRLVHGFRDSAGEVGHTIVYPGGRRCPCGQKGCVEAYASATSTAARAQEALNEGRKSSLEAVFAARGVLTSRDVYEYVEAGDDLAREIADGTARALAILCVNLAHTTSPQLILFTGGMAAAGEVMLSRIRHFFNEYIWSSRKEQVRIALGELWEDAGIVGNAALARDSEHDFRRVR
jgi:glucokinase